MCILTSCNEREQPECALVVKPICGLGWGELGPHLTQCSLGWGLPSRFLPSGILIHPAVWPQQTLAENLGECCAAFWGSGSSTHVPSGILIHPAECSNRHGPQSEGRADVPLSAWGGAQYTSNTMLPGPRPTCVPSGILIHPAVCPE